VIILSVALVMSTAAAVPASTSAPVDPNAKVCRKLPPPVGTRLGARRVCKTQAEWDQERFDAKQALELMQNRRPLEAP
jgi:hypothetical protein